MMGDNQKIARFLFLLNVVPGALSLVCLLLPMPPVWIAIALGLGLLFGYWRLSRGKELPISERVFWLVSAILNLAAALFYVASNIWQEGWLGVGVAVGILWTLGTAGVSVYAFRQARTPEAPADEVPGE